MQQTKALISAMTGESRGGSRAAAPGCGFSRGRTARSGILSWGAREVGQLPEQPLLSVALVLENSFSWLWSSVSDIPFGLKMAFRFGGRLDLLMAFRSSNLCLGDLGGLQLIASEMCLLGSPPCPSWWPPLTCALGSDLYAGGMFCPKVPPIKLPLTGSLWGTPPQCTRRCS